MTHTFTALFSVIVLLFAGQQFRLSGVLIAAAVIGLFDLLRVTRWRLMDSALAWPVVAFLVLLVIQAINAGRIAEGWISIPDHARLVPFGIDREMSVMGLAGWLVVAVMALAAPYINKQAVRDNALTLAAVVAGLGLLQHYTGATGFYWWVPFDSEFFSIFGYVNNAGAFFLLAGCLALRCRFRFSLPLFALFWFCAWVIHCRYAMAALPVVAAFVVTPSRFRRPALYIALFTGFVAAWFCADYLVGDRWHEYQINADLIRRFPIWGSGTWSHHILSSCFAPDYIRDIYAGKPNSHNDWLMFGVEYGITGIALLVSSCALFLARCGKGLMQSPAGVGLVVLAGHSLIDMPLHCPAVVAMAVVLVATETQIKTKQTNNQPERKQEL